MKAPGHIPMISFDCPACGEILEESMTDFEIVPSKTPTFLLSTAECDECGEHFDVELKPSEWM